MSVLMIFIDGIGVGELDERSNPFARFPSAFFNQFKGGVAGKLPFGGLQTTLDATMGVPGLPQSATGQTALLTGVNAARKLGRHLPGFPTKTLQEILFRESIFLKLQQRNKDATFANAFSPHYFSRSRRRISATTRSVQASRFPFRMIDCELRAGEAVSHDLTNAFLRDLGFEVPLRTPAEAAVILSGITDTVDFCLFEYFLTDRVGHRRDMAAAQAELQKLHVFLHTLVSETDLTNHLIFLTSDHGNFEDLSVRTHTVNRVPVSAWGTGSAAFISGLACIQDISAAVLRHLQ